jgi:hypothetical protein
LEIDWRPHYRNSNRMRPMLDTLAFEPRIDERDGPA